MNWKIAAKYWYLLFPLLVLFMVTSCSGVEIVGSNSTHVWVRSPVLSVGDSNGLAQGYCAKLGKTATLESDLTVAQGDNSILVYKCE